MSKRKSEKEGSSDKGVKARKSEKTSLEESNTDHDEREFVGEVKTLLRNKATLLSGLNKLRDTLKSKEPRSFAVFKEFIRENSECPEVYKVLEKGRQQQTPLELQIALEILENLFLFTAEDPSSFGQIGMYHVRRILHNHLKLIYSCLNPTCHVNMIKGALRLLVAMVTQGVSAAREVVAVFDYTLKALGSVVNKRDLKASEDIRTCFIHFIISFLMYGDDATIRHVLDIKGFVSSIFKLFPSDPPDVVNLVLTVLHHKVVQNNAIPKKTKVQFFSPFVLTKLASLYDYDKEENMEEDEQEERQTIKERIHKMLQDICCTFKFGICFANKMGMFSGRSNNPVLLRFLQSLPKHDQNLHLRQLIIQILKCCPDLVQPYLSSQSTTYEPRLSLPWLTNMNFITRLYSALPFPSDMVEKSSIRLTDESVQPLLNTVLPSVLTRANLNQGIQHSSQLVKNTTLTLLVLILKRAYNLLGYCEKERLSTIPQQSFQGLSFVEMFREALLRSLPDVKTLISLRQNLVASEMSKDKSQERGEGEDVDMGDGLITSRNTASPSLLLARVLQALHFYQKIQPSIFSTTAFDLGKLLPGQQDLIDRIFTPIVQHYTLEILSDLPRGMFKWSQQKSKNGPSYMYSVLKMFVQASSNKIKSKAKCLIIKFLQDTGIISEDLTEVDTWLKHLNMPAFEHHKETLLVFLDSVCHSVAMEPYTYTDVVMEMTSEAKARQAKREKFSLLLNVDNYLHEPSVAFSPLIVRALMAHTQMISVMQDKYTNDQLCSIAQYINLVIQDVLRNAMNPLPLILTVKRFYGNEVISVDCASLKSTHQSLISYVDTWIGDSTSTEAGEYQDEDETSFGLEAFLQAQASNPSQESLVRFLSDLNEAQLHQALGPCVQLFLSKFTGDVRPLVDQLMVKPCCMTGSTGNEDIFPLLKELPFANLLWQVFGPLLKTLNVNGHTENQGARNISKENKKIVKVFLHIQHPGVQTYLVDSLQKEDISTFPCLCNNLLQYLSAFVSQATKYSINQKGNCRQDNKSRCQGDKSVGKETRDILTSALSLVFLLIDAMNERLETFPNCGNKSEKAVSRKSKQSLIMKTESILGGIESRKDKNTDDFKVTKSEEYFQQIQEEFLKTLLQSPVLLNCFLFKFDSDESTATASIWSGLTICIGDLLHSIVDSIESETERKLLKPYTRKICEKAVDVVTKATVKSDVSPDGPTLQALQLLQVFSPFCDQASLSEPIAKLLELPFEALVKKSQNLVEPTIYFQTLLALLDSKASHVNNYCSNQESVADDVIKGAGHVSHLFHVNLEYSQHSVIDSIIKESDQLTSLASQDSSLVDYDSVFSHMIDVSNQKAALLSAADFVKLAKLLQEVPSMQLDRVLLKLLRTSPRYLLEVDTSFLDHCLDNVTEDRVAIATILIASNASLRVHFEQRCTSRSQDRDVRQVYLKDHHWDLLPVLLWYFSYTESTGALSSENKVVSYLSENYWPHLWSWIREPKKNTSRTQDLGCAALKLLLIIKSHDTKDTRKLLSKLLDLIPSQSWDVYQMSIIRMMLDLLLKNSTNENKQRVLVGSVVSVCMVNISLMLKYSSVDDKSLITHAVSMLLDIVSTHSDWLLQGEDSLVEVEAWSTFVKNCLKYRFDCTVTLQCMTACVKPLYNSTKHESLAREFPLTTMYQLILSHSKFLDIMLEDNEQSDVKLKESLLELVVAIAELCPECCESSHLPVFFGSYTATLSKTDQSILYLLHLYERAQVPLSSFRPYLWGKAALDHHKIKKIQGPSLWQQPSTNEVLELLDVTTLNRSALDFPLERKLRPRVQSDVAAKDNLSSLYDPCFILPLFCHLLSQNSVVDCRKFVERGGLGYTVSALSSRDERMRKAASHVLSRCLVHMDAASFREKKQVYLLLESLKNGITDVNARVSSVITRFVSRAAYVMLHAENQMYVLVNSFLLQRAVMDLREVPLFYTLFNSSSLQHRTERQWILQLLVEGLRDAQDYYVYKKRHVMELAMSYHDSQMSDQQSRKLVISLMNAALSIHSAAFDLAKNYAIVGWIHSLCLSSPSDTEKLGTCLRLLHTLWFTIQRGKPGACGEVDSGDASNSTPYPPNLCGESLLVCKTLIKLYSSSSTLNDLPMFLELLESVLSHLRQSSPQGSHLTHQEVLQLITLWCELYNESQVLNALKIELQLTGQESREETSSKDEKGTFEKQKSFNLLLDIIVLWRPTLILEENSATKITDGVLMLACNFGLHFATSVCPTADHSDQSLLKVVKWFRYCVASSASLQKYLLRHVGEPCLRYLLFLFGCVNGAKTQLVQELNMIFLVLLSRVQHMENDWLGTTASEMVKLLSSDVYREIMSGVVEILLPLCPSPLIDETAENVNVEVTQLVSAFLKDLWFIHPVPGHFLSLVSINKNTVSSKLSNVFNKGSTKLKEMIISLKKKGANS